MGGVLINFIVSKLREETKFQILSAQDFQICPAPICKEGGYRGSVSGFLQKKSSVYPVFRGFFYPIRFVSN